MQKIRVGGVPEHFNHPWHLAIEKGVFAKQNIELEWVTYKGGTGAMTQGLRNDEVDMCVVLTEGIIKDILAGNPSKIVSHYVESPLTWGIFSGAKNNISFDQIFEKKIAISRNGSGSHLMPQIHAHEAGEKLEADQFQIINNLDGAISSLENLESDVFYWEKFTTKPYVDSGIFKSLGEFKPPWPCFVVAARDEVISEKPSVIQTVLNLVYESAKELSTHPERVDVISAAYKINQEDVALWFSELEWSSKVMVDQHMIENVLNSLVKCEMIELTSNINLDQLICDFK